MTHAMHVISLSCVLLTILLIAQSPDCETRVSASHAHSLNAHSVRLYSAKETYICKEMYSAKETYMHSLSMRLRVWGGYDQ